jgi:hypothetical protein
VPLALHFDDLSAMTPSPLPRLRRLLAVWPVAFRLPAVPPRRAALLLGVLALVAPQAGRATAIAAPLPRAGTPLAASDTVRGVVFDSLANVPLAEAFVLAEPGGASVSTDSLGRFTLVADARITRVTVYHEALDEIGFGALVAERPAEATRWSGFTVAIPSMETIWEAVCGEPRPAGEKGGVLIGSTRLPDDRTRIGGAGIRVQWEAVLPRTRLVQLEELDARSDSTGSFALCGVPNVGELALIALSTEYASSALSISLTERPLRRIDVVMAPSDGPIDRWPTITGRVLSPELQPIAGAAVFIDGVDSAAVTDSAGRFTLVQVPPGSRMVSAEAGGFVTGTQQVDVLYADTPEVIVPLQRGLSIAGLEGFAVTERRVIRRDREEFELRRREGLALYVDTVQIREAGSLRAALEAVPGLEITTISGETDPARFAIAARGRSLGVNSCDATILVDGFPASLQELHSVAVDQLAAVEIYRSAAFAPPRFAERAESNCALLLFWTQFGLRP